VTLAMPQLRLGPNAEYMLRFRYLAPGEEPAELFERVAANLASVERDDRDGWAARFLDLMTSWEFLPNAPTLLGAGRPLQQLHACFVLPVEDSIDGIFDTLRMSALVHSNGGGTGFSFSALRGRGEPIATGGVSTGVVSFMRLFDAETEVIKHGGTGWGANMGVLRVDHPDVREFATAKSGGGALRNFNLSVAVDDVFMERALADSDSEAAALLTMFAAEAWRGGDPGLLFADRIEDDNPAPSLGPLEATNPCGEAPLLPFEACCLGGLNVARFATPGHIDLERLRSAAGLALRMMDNVIEVSNYPLPQIAEATRRTRKIGIGVMGFADLLIDLGIPYDSLEAEGLARRLMAEVHAATTEASAELAAERGSFPAFADSVFADHGVRGLRNATTTSNAPNSTIGVIAGCSPGIEPLFALGFTRHLANGDTLEELNPAFVRVARDRGFASDDLMAHVRAHGSVRGREDVPADVQRVFATAHDIAPEWHVRVQAAFQESTELGISKTINVPNDATAADVRDAYALAWELGCKGVTIFRDGCLDRQFAATGDGDCEVCA
jgi:ribonucleoside-diphosphate reductase alpha chain